MEVLLAIFCPTNALMSPMYFLVGSLNKETLSSLDDINIQRPKSNVRSGQSLGRFFGV